MQDRSSEFERHRPRLFGIAYRMLSSRADAEDMLQDAYLRWHRGASDELRSPEAWLVTTVTRLCIDRLRAVRAEREHYVGPWLPEPLIGEAALAADAPAELSSSLSKRVVRFALTFVNGEPALAMRTEGRLFSIITVLTDGTRILDVYTVLNPNKLKASAATAHG